MPLSPSVAEWLNAQGHKAVHAHDIGLSQAPDSDIMRKAAKEDRIIMTCDLDFPRLLALTGDAGPSVILFRGGNYSDAKILELLEGVLRTVPERDLKQILIVVENERIRRRKLPIKIGD